MWAIRWAAVTLLALVLLPACNEPQRAIPAAAPIQIVIHADGSVELGGEHLKNHDLLAERLRALVAGGSQPEFRITADKTASYAMVEDVMRIAQASGVTHIGMIGTEMYVQ